MFRIAKSFTFESAHHIPGLPEGHKCSGPHGHSYTVTVFLEREDLVKPGFVTDFGDLAPFGRCVNEFLDRVEIETNGTKTPVPELVAAVAQFNVSPKLSTFGSGMPHEQRIAPEALHTFAACGKAVFKFVACSVADLNEIANLEQDFQLSPVWVMPAATTHDEVVAGLRTLVDPVLAHGWNLTGRLHILLWGDERGR